MICRFSSAGAVPIGGGTQELVVSISSTSNERRPFHRFQFSLVWFGPIRFCLLPFAPVRLGRSGSTF